MHHACRRLVDARDETRPGMGERDPGVPEAGGRSGRRGDAPRGSGRTSPRRDSAARSPGKWQSSSRSAPPAPAEFVRPGLVTPVGLGVDTHERRPRHHAPSTVAASSRRRRVRSRSRSSAAFEKGSRVTATSWFPRTTSGASSAMSSDQQQGLTTRVGDEVSGDADDVRPARSATQRHRAPYRRCCRARGEAPRWKSERCPICNPVQDSRKAGDPRRRRRGAAASRPRATHRRSARFRGRQRRLRRPASRHPRDVSIRPSKVPPWGRH